MTTFACETCLRDFPISEFPNLTVGTICASCLAGKDSAKAEKRLENRALAMAKRLSDVDPKALNLAQTARVRDVVADVYRNFGGPTGFADHLSWVILKLSAEQPLKPSVGHLMLGFMKLHHSVEQSQDDVDAREMTDEQLKREQQIEMTRLILEAMNDPDKRESLEDLLMRQGVKLQDAEPAEILGFVAKRTEELEDEPILEDVE